MVGRGWKAHSDGRGFGSPPKRAGRRQESLTEARRGHEALPKGREGSGSPPGGQGGVESHFW